MKTLHAQGQSARGTAARDLRRALGWSKLVPPTRRAAATALSGLLRAWRLQRNGRGIVREGVMRSAAHITGRHPIHSMLTPFHFALLTGSGLQRSDQQPESVA